jgi:hypothetical protein
MYEQPRSSNKNDNYYDPITNPTGSGTTERYIVYEDRIDNGKKQTRAYLSDPFEDEIKALNAINSLSKQYATKQYTVEPSNDKIGNNPKEVVVTSPDGRSKVRFYVKLSNYYRSPYDQYKPTGRNNTSSKSQPSKRDFTYNDVVALFGKSNVEIINKGDHTHPSTIQIKGVKL